MSTRDPILSSTPPQGRPADRIAAVLAGLGLVGSIAATLWFFLGFAETDPGFSPASSAFLLSMGLGAFAIVPSAVILRLAHAAWRQGFRRSQGWWTLLLALPWIGLSIVILGSDWLPLWLGFVPLLISVPLSIWAIVSLILERGRRGGH